MVDVISTHAPAWGATKAVLLSFIGDYISTHAPAWGATEKQHKNGERSNDISTHAPAWGATVIGIQHRKYTTKFLLTPPRGGRPFADDGETMVDVISTHAPAWGATTRKAPHADRNIISTHAPAWGATAYGPAEKRGAGHYFYSRPRVGGDFRIYGSRRCGDYFYSRPRVGGDKFFYSACSRHGLFLLTPPRGGRHRGKGSGPMKTIISTHAPAWGATAIFHKHQAGV